MTRLFDLYRVRDGQFMMRASLAGLVLAVPLDGPAAATVMVEQVARKSETPTHVWSIGVPRDQYHISLAREPLGVEI